MGGVVKNKEISCMDGTKEKKLTNKDKLFVQEYLIDLDVERAALTAGYSKSMAASKAYQWVRDGKVKPQVFKAIKKAMNKRAGKLEITANKVLAEYAKLGFLDPRKFYDNKGELIPIHKLPADVAATLTGMDVDEIFVGRGENRKAIGHTKKIKFTDKKSALDSVAKHLGMFIERHEHTGKDGKSLFPDLSDADLDARIAAIMAESREK